MPCHRARPQHRYIIIHVVDLSCIYGCGRPQGETIYVEAGSEWSLSWLNLMAWLDILQNHLAGLDLSSGLVGFLVVFALTFDVIS